MDAVPPPIVGDTVTLGMYDLPMLREANDRLWAYLRDRLVARGWRGVPELIDRSRAIDDALADPGLVLGHTCGYPLRTRFAGRLRVVATPDYRGPYASGGRHCSVVVVRHDDPAADLAALYGRVAAVNGFDSNTGMNLLRAAVAPLAGGQAFFGGVLETGAHVASLAAVADGMADVAAIDGVTFDLVARHTPDDVAGVRVLTRTADSPNLPLVTRMGAPDALVAALRAALDEAARAPELAAAREALGLAGFLVLPDEAYDRVLELERAAAAAGYPRLA
ncbi:ABC-type phosphate/phosphonate transport system, substrate-binding protein [Pseudoxanthobacter soli DSM 19599]|uniref:ABC-type phosphate/phosphonate transport system, substrate-binding protein n=1 Tax=Pseudoxanthobacter soli DSM 19599 TaxID=1123029 RepID=A0A1M7ZQV1_9HYPH|nr:PhnD/SsuA/transferrin family substrate-binding protein [Pseudoxanthobacter soli]SHO67265.1 ABC-type phosphate/phosphonate transport system, substrate-binding protein [Pseudoxanthobacter soli DSM 19599]